MNNAAKFGPDEFWNPTGAYEKNSWNNSRREHFKSSQADHLYWRLSVYFFHKFPHPQQYLEAPLVKLDKMNEQTADQVWIESLSEAHNRKLDHTIGTEPITCWACDYVVKAKGGK